MLFCFLLATLSFAIIFSRNAVSALLFLILAYFFSGVFLILKGVEFLGYIIIIVYVGAIAVLFLFVVMTLDIQNEGAPTRASSFGEFVPLMGGLVLGCVAYWANYKTVLVWVRGGGFADLIEKHCAVGVFDPSSVGSFAFLLYTTGSGFLLMSGLLLLMGIVSAVILSRPR